MPKIIEHLENQDSDLSSVRNVCLQEKNTTPGIKCLRSFRTIHEDGSDDDAYYNVGPVFESASMRTNH